MGDLYYQADSLRQLGVTLQALGRGEEARTRWREALVIFERLQSTNAEDGEVAVPQTDWPRSIWPRLALYWSTSRS